MNVLIVEDEIPLAQEIKEFLESEGFNCSVAHKGRVASELIYVNEYDLLLLDLGLPDYDGLNILKEAIAGKTNLAIIILSARTSLEDKVKGLNMGADDYLPKPFSLLELKSRIMAVMRRKHGLKVNIIQINNIEMDLDKREVSCNQQVITLTRKEYDILSFLVLHKNKVVSRLQISEHIWGDIIEENYNSNYIDVHVKNLRKKLAPHINGEFLETIRGIGFRFNELQESEP
jgi:DNA-binding response OmpR family regulator